jgi:putative ABC transport system permease protein
MKIPITYNVRNLRVRRVSTLMTALGAALTVAVMVSVLALVQGLRTSFEVTGNPTHLLVLRKGATSELVSVISRENFQDILSHAGIARDSEGRPLASLEMVTVVNLELPGGKDMNVNLRGLEPVGWKMRDQVHLYMGRMFEPGKRELVVGRSVAQKCPAARLGGHLRFGRGTWEVVGVMDGGRSTFNSDIFADLNQVSSDYQRHDFLSSALVQAEPGGMNTLAHAIEDDRRLNVLVKPERQYYEEQMGNARPVQFMGTFVAIIMAVGSAFAAMNTMYAAVARRSAEIGTLRVLGFSRSSVLASFLLESVLISLIGGAIGCLLTLPLNNIETGIGSFTTWSQLSFNFHVTPQIMLAGVIFASVIGAIGGLLPARNAANKQIIAALKAR